MAFFFFFFQMNIKFRGNMETSRRIVETPNCFAATATMYSSSAINLVKYFYSDCLNIRI